MRLFFKQLLIIGCIWIFHLEIKLPTWRLGKRGLSWLVTNQEATEYSVAREKCSDQKVVSHYYLF